MVKVADFGLSEDIYARNYFRQGRQGEDGEAPVKLPLRWMAVESLNDGVFSEKTDVVIKPFACMHAVLAMMNDFLVCFDYFHHAVVIWCDVLGGILTGENPLPWSGPLFSHRLFGERRATGTAIQCSLLPGNVKTLLY